MNGTPTLTLVLIAVTAIVSYRGFTRPGFAAKYIFDNRAVLGRGEYYRAITSGFLHADWGHLGLNMFGLYLFGSDIELAAGAGKLAAVYFASMIGGGAASLLLHRGEPYRALGASGGVYGVLLAHIFLFPGTSLVVFPIPMPLPSWLYVILFLVGSLIGIRARRDNIGHDAHLGGAVTGLLAATFFYPVAFTRNPGLYLVVLGIALGGLLYLSRGGGVPFQGLRFGSRSKRRLRVIRSDEPDEEDLLEDRAVREALLDNLLEKISSKGMESLTPKEKELLERLSRETEH